MDNNIEQRVYDSFGVLSPEQRAAQAGAPVGDMGQEPNEAPYVPVDIYQRDAISIREEAKKVRPKGSSSMVRSVAKSVIEGDGSIGLAKMYDEAEDTVEELREQGERTRADIARKQYMEDKFIPAVETVIRFTSPDELLNCKDVLAALDKYALGTGSMSGYTASYIKQAYGDLLGKDLDGRFQHSDPFVCDAVNRIKRLVYIDNIRSAVGVAKQTKDMIDRGEHMANSDDYALLSKVANF